MIIFATADFVGAACAALPFRVGMAGGERADYKAAVAQAR